ncbi:MAG: hypothetical protein LBS73_06845 [Campylobacteraceae bacterium]|jgi:NADH-quinone oxidoreductase subunit F|nr:hypothetical protein [Campylobacteraceae bacterium]
MSKLTDAFKVYGVSAEALDTKGSVIFIGTLPLKDNEKLIKNLCENAKNFIYFSPIEDAFLSNRAQKYIKYEAGSEAGVLALIAKSVLQDSEVSGDVREYLDALDEGYLSAESNVGEEEIEEALSLFEGERLTLLLGEDIQEHPDSDAVAGLIALICRFKPLGVSLPSGKELSVDKADILPPHIDELRSFDGTAVYFYPSNDERFYASAQFALAAKIKDKDEVIITVKSGEYKRVFEVSSELKGTIAILGVNEHKGFRYEVAKITKGR